MRSTGQANEEEMPAAEEDAEVTTIVDSAEDLRVGGPGQDPLPSGRVS